MSKTLIRTVLTITILSSTAILDSASAHRIEQFKCFDGCEKTFLSERKDCEEKHPRGSDARKDCEKQAAHAGDVCVDDCREKYPITY